MRFLFRWAFRLLLLLIVAGVALVLLRDTLMRALVENRLRALTGLDARIERLEVGLGTPRISIAHLRLYNPAEFGGSPLVDVPDLYIEYRWAGWDPRSVRIKLLRLEISELQIVQSRAGRWNLADLQERVRRASGSDRVAAAPIAGPFSHGVDLLNLSLGTIRYTSLAAPGKNGALEMEMKNELMSDVTSLDQVQARILQAMLRRGLNLSRAGRGGFRLDLLPDLIAPAIQPKP